MNWMLQCPVMNKANQPTTSRQIKHYLTKLIKFKSVYLVRGQNCKERKTKIPTLPLQGDQQNNIQCRRLKLILTILNVITTWLQNKWNFKRFKASESAITPVVKIFQMDNISQLFNFEIPLSFWLDLTVINVGRQQRFCEVEFQWKRQYRR